MTEGKLQKIIDLRKAIAICECIIGDLQEGVWVSLSATDGAEIENTLPALQQVVGGYIETVTLAADCCIICNEEGRLEGLPYNLTFCGVSFVGPILVVGVDGDEFTGLDDRQIDWLLQQLKGGKYGANRKEDASPVGHAKWIDTYKNFETAECSSCHSQFEVTFGSESNGALWDGFKHFYKYCPNCGAKMDLEEE